ncbi:MAG TPA: hypothetical protein VFV34_00205 [Blastocatellia bacterium]|nr:hypothetical protein [Blastocatellia bacterium]
MAMQSELTGVGQDSAPFCVDQYNRVLARLAQIDPDVGSVSQPLSAGSSLAVAAMACKQLAAYYEDEVGTGWGHAHAFAFDAQAFKDFWCKAGREVEDLGEFIRESVEEWARRRKEKPEAPKV